MMQPLDFYFGFSSPNACIASEKIEALAAKHDRRIEWHPILLGIVFKHTGGAPLTEVPLKGTYSKCNFVRSAAFHGVDGEPFWGVDHLDQVERWLGTGGW